MGSGGLLGLNFTSLPCFFFYLLHQPSLQMVFDCIPSRSEVKDENRREGMYEQERTPTLIDLLYDTSDILIPRCWLSSIFIVFVYIEQR